MERGIEQHEDEEDRDWHDYRQLCHRTLLILERAAPFDPVPGRQFHLLVDRGFGGLHEAVHIPAPHVHLDHRIALQLFAPPERVDLGHTDIRDLRHRYPTTGFPPPWNLSQILPRP